jgi:sensor histidine kinase YesM
VGLIFVSARTVTIRRENEIKEKELMMQSHLKDAQLKYLQAQINPHFLFNTLNAGVQLAMMEDAERTGIFLQNMAEFFRYNVRRNNQDATLGEEIHLVDNYMYILNVRFSGEILFEKDIDESLLNVRVPSMILQPIVENAVSHGIRGLDRQGRIELAVSESPDDQTIRISIWDNGAGMEEERIQQVLLGQVQENQSDSNGVGLGNVIERLRLYFHDQAKLEIFSEGKNKGTEILITIPKEGEGSCTE